MWHPIKRVAETFFLDERRLRDFAIKNEKKYEIIIDKNSVEVNTWHADALIKDFRAEEATKKETEKTLEAERKRS